MTATNVLIQQTAVHVYSDGAMYNADGKIIGFTSKIVTLPHLNSVITFRGAAVAKTPMIDAIASAGQSFDHLQNTIGDVLRQCKTLHQDALDRCETGSEFEVIVAGFSSTGPAAYVVGSEPRYNHPEFTVIPMKGFVWLPNTDELAASTTAKLQADMPPGGDAFDLDPVKHGILVMNAQRAVPILHESINREMITIGGFIQMATVTAHDISTRIIHRWPDRIGDRIMV